MANKKVTRRALTMSIISLILCCAMLVGTTFAWFTDEVSSGRNTIAAGNLDVELYNNDVKVDDQTKLFTDVDPELWEPGAVAFENLQVRNVGTLALKYNLTLNVLSETTIEESGVTYKLSDVIKVGVVEGGITSADRNAVISSVSAWTPLSSFNLNKQDIPLEAKTNDTEIGIVLYWQPNDNEIDNHYNLNNGKSGNLELEIGVALAATQLVSETDSFGPDYDAAAPGDTFGGEEELPEADPEDENTIIIDSAEKLVGFASAVNGGNNYAGKTVVLSNDINLTGVQWTPIGDCNSGKYFQGTFDGQGYTIYNLYVDKSTDPDVHSTAGLFGWVDAAKATIKNVNISRATVKGSHWVGAVAGYMTGRIENCTVTNSTITGYNVNNDANGDKVGGIVGCLNEHSYLNGNTVSDCTITGNRDIGGIAGSVAASTYEMKNNRVKDTNLIYTEDKTYASAGEIVSGRTGYVADETNTASNVSIKKNLVDGLIQDGNTYYVSSAAGMKYFSAKALTGNNSTAETATIVLQKDIDMGGAEFSAVIAQRGDTLTFKGNGHTISNVNVISGANDNTTGQAAMFYAYPNSTLTVSDLTLKDITVTTDENGTGYGATVVGYCEGNANLNNVDVVNATVIGVKSSGMLVGHLSGSLTATNCDVSGTVTLADFAEETDGHYAAKYIGTLAGPATLNNCNANVTVNGNLNAANIGDIYGRKTAAGSVTVDGSTPVDDATTLSEVLSSGGNVTLTDDVQMESATTAPYGNKYAVALNGGVLDGNGKELEVVCYGDDYGIMTTGGTIKNLTIKEGCRAVMIMYATEDVILDNVNIGGDGVLYPINTGETGPNGATGIDLVVTNSTLAGWTSFGNAIESASFTNVKFEQGTYYNNIYGRVLKPYVNTTLTGCSFTEHMNLDLSSLIEGQKVTITNCTVNGQAVTADVFTVPTTDAEYDTELFTVDLPSWATSITDCVIFN